MSGSLEGVEAAVITVSDRSASGERKDKSGKIIADALAGEGAIVERSVVPDGVDSVLMALRSAVSTGSRIVITTGGTGIAPRDFTPEATASIIARPLPGIPEHLRRVNAVDVPTAALSRGIAGVTGGPIVSVVVNLPGSPHGAESGVRELLTLLPHVLDQLAGHDH